MFVHIGLLILVILSKPLYEFMNATRVWILCWRWPASQKLSPIPFSTGMLSLERIFSIDRPNLVDNFVVLFRQLLEFLLNIAILNLINWSRVCLFCIESIAFGLYTCFTTMQPLSFLNVCCSLFGTNSFNRSFRCKLWNLYSLIWLKGLFFLF